MGAMDKLYKYMGIRENVSLILYMFWIFSAAEGKSIYAEAGRTVNLPCNNESISNLTQLTWNMNQVQQLFSFSPQLPIHITPEAKSLNMTMSESESQLYGLFIERAQKSHTGNYTCQTTTATGVWEQKWELIIKDPNEVKHWNKRVIAVATTVPCVCILIFIIALTIMLKVCKKSSDNGTQPLPRDMHEQTEDIYENCLESRRKHRAH